MERKFVRVSLMVHLCFKRTPVSLYSNLKQGLSLNETQETLPSIRKILNPRGLGSKEWTVSFLFLYIEYSSPILLPNNWTG